MQDTALVLICTLKLRDIVFYARNLINCIEINWNPVEIITTAKKTLNSTFKKSNINCYYKNIYCAPVEFAVQPDCRPPARYFPGGITVNPGGLQYNNAIIAQIQKIKGFRALL